MLGVSLISRKIAQPGGFSAMPALGSYPELCDHRSNPASEGLVARGTLQGHAAGRVKQDVEGAGVLAGSFRHRGVYLKLRITPQSRPGS